MELPTYTSIWRIEKRLYKLYDFRLPMPLPVGQIAVFTAVTVPYILLLTLFGLPFNHNLFWLYVLPPGLLTWLATRPVLESKRLPELLISQMRYLGEPSTWCRMAPLAEKDQVLVFGRVWRRASVAATAEVAQTEIASAEQAVGELPATARPALPVATPVARPVPAQAATADPVPARQSRGRQAGAGWSGSGRFRSGWRRRGGRAGGGSGCAATGRAGPAGRRAVAEPLGACGGPVAPAFGTGGAGGTRLGQAARAGRGGAANPGRWCRLGQRRGRANLAGSGPGRTGRQGPSRGAGQAARAGRLCRGRGCAARDSGHERPGHQWPGHRWPGRWWPGRVPDGAGQPSRDSGTGRDAGTGWPMVGYGTAAERPAR